MPVKDKETVAKYNNTYYTKNKEKLLKNALTKVMCDVCNKECSKVNMSKHIRTEKHKLNVKINSLQNN